MKRDYGFLLLPFGVMLVSVENSQNEEGETDIKTTIHGNAFTPQIKNGGSQGLVKTGKNKTINMEEPESDVLEAQMIGSMMRF